MTIMILIIISSVRDLGAKNGRTSGGPAQAPAEIFRRPGSREASERPRSCSLCLPSVRCCCFSFLNPKTLKTLKPQNPKTLNNLKP